MASSTIYLKGALVGQRITVSAIKGAGRSSAAVVFRDDKSVYAVLKYDSD